MQYLLLNILNYIIINKKIKASCMQEYDKWNNLKKNLATKNSKFTFKTREIYWLNVGQNLGYEVFGKGEEFLRPVLVFRKFSKESFLGIPLTSQVKNDMFHFNFTPINKEKENSAMLSQLKLFSSKRIHDKMGKISNDDFDNLKVKLKCLLDL
jgi:hypothetical protein